MTYFMNKFRNEAISIVDQFVIAYGGIRGAVCYGLVVSLDKNIVADRDMFTTTTVAVILMTSLFQVCFTFNYKNPMINFCVF